MQLVKRIPDGSKVPAGHGIAYYDFSRRQLVCCPWGIHLVVWGWHYAVEKLSQTPPLPSDETWKKHADDAYNRGTQDERQRILAALKKAGLNGNNSSAVVTLEVIENLGRMGHRPDFAAAHNLAVVAMNNSPLHSDDEIQKRRLAAEFEKGHKVGYGKGYAAAKHDLNSVLDKVVSAYLLDKVKVEIAAGRVYVTETPAEGGESNQSQSNSNSGYVKYGDSS